MSVRLMKTNAREIHSETNQEEKYSEIYNSRQSFPTPDDTCRQRSSEIDTKRTLSFVNCHNSIETNETVEYQSTTELIVIWYSNLSGISTYSTNYRALQNSWYFCDNYTEISISESRPSKNEGSKILAGWISPKISCIFPLFSFIFSVNTLECIAFGKNGQRIFGLEKLNFSCFDITLQKHPDIRRGFTIVNLVKYGFLKLVISNEVYDSNKFWPPTLRSFHSLLSRNKLSVWGTLRFELVWNSFFELEYRRKHLVVFSFKARYNRMLRILTPPPTIFPQPRFF